MARSARFLKGGDGAPSVGEADCLPEHVRRAPCLLLGLGSPEGLALDHLGRNLFWTDSRLDRIEVAKLDGSQRRVLFETDLVNPRGIAADAVRGYLGVVCASAVLAPRSGCSQMGGCVPVSLS